MREAGIEMEKRTREIVGQIRAFSNKGILVEPQRKEVGELFNELAGLIGIDKASELCGRFMTPLLRDAIASTKAAA